MKFYSKTHLGVYEMPNVYGEESRRYISRPALPADPEYLERHKSISGPHFDYRWESSWLVTAKAMHAPDIIRLRITPEAILVSY